LRRSGGDDAVEMLSIALSEIGLLVHNFKLVIQYWQILLAKFLAPRELVVVQCPLTDVLINLPPAYYRPKYRVL